MRLLANKQNNDPRPLAHFRIRTDPYIYIYIYIYIIKKKKKKLHLIKLILSKTKIQTYEAWDIDIRMLI
jgi:hypothetical protein